MSLNLLPVKTGNEQFPVRYRDIFSGNWNPYHVFMCERNKALYMLTQQNYDSSYPTSNPGNAQLHKMNLFTSETYKICDFTVNQFRIDTNTTGVVGGMLVDDNYIYFSFANVTYPTISVFKLKTVEGVAAQYPLEPVGTYKWPSDSSTNINCYGKIKWVDDHTIAMATERGFCFFNTKTKTFTREYNENKMYCNDFAVGEMYVIATRTSTSTPNVYILNRDDKIYSTMTLPSSNVACITYDNGKFYVANNSKLYIYDEATLTVERTINGAWGDPSSISITNGVVYIAVKSSNKFFIYNINTSTQNSVYLQWVISSFSSSYQNYPYAWEGFCFILQNNLCIMDNSGISKYNFGPKYENVLLMLNKSEEHNYQFDSRFIQFEDTFMTMRDGDLEYNLQTIDSENHIKSASISKSDYKFLNQIQCKTAERSDDQNE